MNLKSITLHGFKSFADKTPIPLKDGFTAIIGPNGCGKSNVADAIRWTLGEQSAKSLRGKNMQDVIFSGTEKRRGMSYCEVSLTFDNAGQKIFPTIPFEEVIITRKLDRSGQSEYLINNAKCRRMDIINMLHDTGIGKEGYSIIGQGRVDEILSSKPEDRRNIFEEAAGISKFRAQRNEAEKKLESTKTNLNTIEEVIAEIERQLGPLRKQAEVVKKVEGLEAELKKQEVNLYIYNYENNESIKKGILEKKSEAQSQMKAKEAAYRGCSDEYDKSLEENATLDKRYEEQAAELLSLKVDEEKSLGNANLIKEKITNLQNEQNRLQEELRRTDSQLITSDQLIKASKEKQDEKVAEYAEKSREREQKEKKLEQVSQNLLGKEGELERSNANFIQAMQELNMLKNNQSSFIANKSIDEERAKNLKGLLNEKKAKLDEENTAYTYHDAEAKKGKAKMRELINEYNETLSGVNEANEALKGLNEDIVSLQGRLSAAESRYQLQLHSKEEYASFHEPVKRLMTDAKNDPVLKSKILGVTAEIIQVSPEYQSAIDYALGNHIQCVLTENEHDVSGLIAYLKQKNYKRVTFRPRTACVNRPLTNEMRSALHEQGVYGVASDLVACKPEYKDFINSFLGGTIVVDTVYTAEKLIREYGRSFKIVTLDGDIYERSGDITGGSRREQNSGLLSLENEIEQTRALLEKLKKQINQINQSREDRKAEIKESEERIAELNQQISELRISNTLSEDKAKQAFDNVETLKSEISDTAKEYESVVAELKDLTEKLSSIDQLESDVKARQEDYNIALEASKSQKGEQTDERETLVAEVMNIRVECSQIKSAIDNFEIEIDRLKREQEGLQEEKLDLISALKGVENSITNIMQAPEKSSFSESDLKRIKELEDAQSNISNKKKELAENIVKLNEMKERLFNEKAELEQKCIRYDGMIERADDETRFLQEHILEEYDLTYNTAVELRDPEFKVVGAKTTIQDLKREIGKCGQVNRLAVQTLKETEERYDICKSQRDDIQAACDDIMQVITELTTEMTDKFMAAFEKIKANFKEVFVELFGGGTGDLRLNFSETQDPLAAGIDIYAQPPGKNLRSITLLSGGERAFTAICILFAILKLKPMPFCVLDEIEAALDDSNANDFAAFLKRFSNQTQFIVITHRKPTMRHADSIFGITMEEKGITKVVSVEFTDAVKYASDNAAADEEE